jgi:hypothetical protein
MTVKKRIIRRPPRIYYDKKGNAFIKVRRKKIKIVLPAGEKITHSQIAKTIINTINYVAPKRKYKKRKPTEKKATKTGINPPEVIARGSNLEAELIKTALSKKAEMVNNELQKLESQISQTKKTIQETQEKPRKDKLPGPEIKLLKEKIAELENEKLEKDTVNKYLQGNIDSILKLGVGERFNQIKTETQEAIDEQTRITQEARIRAEKIEEEKQKLQEEIDKKQREENEKENARIQQEKENARIKKENENIRIKQEKRNSELSKITPLLKIIAKAYGAKDLANKGSGYFESYILNSEGNEFTSSDFDILRSGKITDEILKKIPETFKNTVKNDTRGTPAEYIKNYFKSSSGSRNEIIDHQNPLQIINMLLKKVQEPIKLKKVNAPPEQSQPVIIEAENKEIEQPIILPSPAVESEEIKNLRNLIKKAEQEKEKNMNNIKAINQLVLYNESLNELIKQGMEPIQGDQIKPELIEQGTHQQSEPIIEEPQTDIEDDEQYGQGLKKNDKYGLTADEVNKIMNYYINNTAKKIIDYKGVFSIDKLSEIGELNNDLPICLIINTAPSYIKFGHYVALYIDAIRDYSIEYYDSFGKPPDVAILYNIKKIVDGISPELYLKMKINRVKEQSLRSDFCGYHCILFLLNRYNGKSFKESTGYSNVLKSEKKIKSFKQKLRNKFGFI